MSNLNARLKLIVLANRRHWQWFNWKQKKKSFFFERKEKKGQVILGLLPYMLSCVSSTSCMHVSVFGLGHQINFNASITEENEWIEKKNNNRTADLNALHTGKCTLFIWIKKKSEGRKKHIQHLTYYSFSVVPGIYNYMNVVLWLFCVPFSR